MLFPWEAIATRLRLGGAEQRALKAEGERLDAMMAALNDLTAEDPEAAWARLREAARITSEVHTRYNTVPAVAQYRIWALGIVRHHAERLFGPAGVREFPLPWGPL